MKKKKPKKSPQSISKTSPPAKSTPSKSEVKDLAPYSPSVVSDAQISSPAEEVSQQSLVGSDLVANTGSASSVETVIVDSSANPSSQVPEAPSVQPELSSVPEDLEVCSDKETSVSTAKLANDDAKEDSLSSQQAVKSDVTIAPSGVFVPVIGVGVDAACAKCNSTAHSLANCPQNQRKDAPERKTHRGRSKYKQRWIKVNPKLPLPAQKETHIDNQHPSMDRHREIVQTEVVFQSKLGTEKDKALGESSGTPSYLQPILPRSGSGISRSSHADVQPDSSEVESSDSELEEGEFSQHEPDFEVDKQKQKSALRDEKFLLPVDVI
ncbi:hypothetical protein Bca4012_064191 [Brassica carinata]|uniref:Uncharacterized protein n=1 Tax=Brassica carinata TaxID=52824 RepID=A0A8X7V9M4_BRACI|nr:hypothetical protein Bca52824_033772 [Brassica carinata]